MSRIAVTSLLFWALAGATYGALRVTFGQRPAAINVRWAPSVVDTTRQQLERRHGLSRGELREGRTWAYYLTDRSRANLRALISDPAIEDTQNLHRTAFRVGFFTPRGPYAASTPVFLEFLTLALLLGGVVNVFIDPIATIAMLARGLIAWVGGRIPAASAEAVGLFRVVFGSALLATLLITPLNAAWAIDPANPVSAPQRLVLRLLSQQPWIVDWIKPWLTIWGLLFVAGAFARTSFVMVTAGALLWAALYTTRIVSHTVSALLVTLICLAWSRWGDAWSVDAWRRRHRPPQPAAPSQEYGFTIWLPGLALGVVFAAAAVAKLRESGLAWILNGTVKYHFLSDSPQAPVDWGLQIGQHAWLSVALSFAAIAVEGLVIVGCLSRAYRYRLAAGTAALLLLLGFWLLQGLFWPAWWILLLSFLPWHLLPPPTARHADRARPAFGSLSRTVYPAVILVLMGQQIVVSALKLEVAPVLSTYDMYATTYGSPEEYENSSGVSYWILAVDDASDMHECLVPETDADVVVRAGSAPVDRVSATRVLERCFAPSVRIQSVSVESRQVNVDWKRWRLGSDKRTPLMDAIPANAIR